MKQEFKKFWNTIRYGDKKTAAYTLFIIILFAGAAVLSASAYTRSEISHAIYAVIMIGLALYLLSKLADEEMKAQNGVEQEAAAEDELSDHPQEETPLTKSKRKKPKGFKKVKVSFPGPDGTEEELTMFLKTYKVPQRHIIVLIDNSQTYHIRECPAYLWKDKRGIHLLLLEETPRELLLPANSVMAMVYQRAVLGDPRKEYLDLREPSLKSAIFSSYIPEYYSMGGNGVFSGFQQAKNLYQIAPDIQFSEKCAKEIMDLLKLPFVVYDQYTKSDNFSEYFKAGHRYQILLRDQVMEPEEYKEKIQELLQEMITANIHEDVFDDTIRQMVMYNIIGSDNGEYYRAQRTKVINQREQKRKKGQKRKG